MPRYFEFTNPTSGLGDELREMLAEREAKRRQDMLDQILQKREARTDEIQRENLRTLTAQREAAEEGRRLQTATGIAGLLQPGQDLPAGAREQLGPLAPFLVESSGPRQGRELISMEESPEGIPTYDVLPSVDRFKGTPKQIEDARLRAEKEAFLSEDFSSNPQMKAIQDFVRAQVRTGDTSLPYQLFQGEQTTPVVRASANRRGVERLEGGQWVPVTGDVPKGAHFLQEPQPPASADPFAQEARTQRLVQPFQARFENAPIVKNFNEIALRADTFNQIINDNPDGVTGPGDLAMIYEFMRALDPTSVVRESEFATAAQAGNIFKGIYAKFNGYLKPEGGRLPPEVRTEFSRLVGLKLASQKKALDNYRKEQGRLIDKALHTTPGTGANYLVDYASPFADLAVPATPPASTGAPGATQTRTIRNPQTGETRTQTSTDGVNWK